MPLAQRNAVVVTRRETCVACAGPVTQPATGRPAKFCSTACRRAADLEVRRLDRRLSTAEDNLVRRRDRLAEIEAGLGFHGGTNAARQARFEVERAELLVAELRARLRAVLPDE